MGIECGETKVLVHVKRMVGRRYAFSPHGRINYDKQFAKDESLYPLQTVVYNIEAYDSCNTVFKSITSVFPVGCEVYVLTNPYYGSKATVRSSSSKEINEIKSKFVGFRQYRIVEGFPFENLFAVGR